MWSKLFSILCCIGLLLATALAIYNSDYLYLGVCIFALSAHIIFIVLYSKHPLTEYASYKSTIYDGLTFLFLYWKTVELSYHSVLTPAVYVVLVVFSICYVLYMIPYLFPTLKRG